MKGLSELAAIAVATSVWETAPVTSVPAIQLCSWCVVETSKGTRHFAGYSLTSYEGRASTAIVQFDPVSLCGITESGRVYQLVGRPGLCADGRYVLSAWLRGQGETNPRYLTLEELDIVAGPAAPAASSDARAP